MTYCKGYFQSIGKDGQTYDLEYQPEEQFDAVDQITKLCFKTVFVHSGETDWFDFKIALIGVNEVKVTDIFLPQNPLYKGKGVAEALIIETGKLFADRTVISSSNKFPILKRESRWDAGTSVWRRLVNRRLAVYDETHDIFKLL